MSLGNWHSPDNREWNSWKWNIWQLTYCRYTVTSRDSWTLKPPARGILMSRNYSENRIVTSQRILGHNHFDFVDVTSGPAHRHISVGIAWPYAREPSRSVWVRTAGPTAGSKFRAALHCTILWSFVSGDGIRENFENLVLEYVELAEVHAVFNIKNGF